MDAYIGEIRAFGFSWAPAGWLVCAGAILQISQYQTLYSVLGDAFGGDGKTTFALPDLQGRTSLGAGQGAGLTNQPFASTDGGESVQLSLPQLSSHTHNFAGGGPAVSGNETASPASDGTSFLTRTLDSSTSPATPIGSYEAATSGLPTVNMAPEMLGSVGANGAHENRQPLLVMNFCICWQGFFPTRP